MAEKQDNIRTYIQRYILLKLGNGDWKPGDKLPSENEFAKTFDCSRLTVRNVLQNFVYSGILESVQGSGYTVSDAMDGSLFSPIGKKYKATRKETRLITKEEFPIKNEWFKELEHIPHDISRSHLIEKIYWTKEDKVIHQFSILNKSEVMILKLDKINESLTNFLIWQGIAISAESNIVLFDNSLEKITKIAREMGWVGDYPVLISMLRSANDWIEISIKIVNRSYFNFKRSRKAMF